MSQHALPDLLLDDPNGLELAELLNNWNAALLSAHNGPSRPAYAVRGTIWLKDTGSAQSVMFYDGNADRELMRADQLTASQVLTLLKTVDGAGSGVDADKLDGSEASAFAKKSENLSGLSNTATARQNLGLSGISLPNTGGWVNVGRGNVHLESNSGDNQNGAGLTIRTVSNPNSGNPDEVGAILAVRSSGQALRFWVGQSVTSTGDNNFQTKSIDAAGTVSAPNFASTSDARLKSKIAQIGSALELVQSLTGVRYEMDGAAQVGVIAQDVEPHLPEVVNKGEDGYLRVSYGQLVAPLIEAVKELAQRVDQLEGAQNDA